MAPTTYRVSTGKLAEIMSRVQHERFPEIENAPGNESKTMKPARRAPGGQLRSDAKDLVVVIQSYLTTDLTSRKSFCVDIHVRISGDHCIDQRIDTFAGKRADQITSGNRSRSKHTAEGTGDEFCRR